MKKKDIANILLAVALVLDLINVGLCVYRLILVKEAAEAAEEE